MLRLYLNSIVRKWNN